MNSSSKPSRRDFIGGHGLGALAVSSCHISNSRPMGPLGRKRDEEAIWGNLPKTRTNHFLIGS
ncbi:MAG: twin-arginine translocation signal domain-containing protein, partial [Planctomycetales bacterium]